MRLYRNTTEEDDPMTTTLTAKDAGVLKAALATILAMSKVIPAEDIKTIGFLCATQPMETRNALHKLSRLYINGHRVFSITPAGDPEEQAVHVEYLLREDDLPGNIQTLWRALYIRLHELAGSPLPGTTISWLNQARKHDTAVVKKMAATLNLGDTVH